MSISLQLLHLAGEKALTAGAILQLIAEKQKSEAVRCKILAASAILQETILEVKDFISQP